MEAKFIPPPAAAAKSRWAALCGAAALVGALSFAGIASAAQALDPPLFIGTPTCPSGTTGVAPCDQFVLPTEVNPLGSTALTINDHGGTGSILDPVWLILGFATTTSALPGIILPSGASVLTSFIAGTPFTASTGLDIYEFLGLPPQGGGGDSESFGNWADAEAALALLNPSVVNPFNPLVGFTIGVFELDGLGLSSVHDTVEIDFSGSGLPYGTMVVAFGCTLTPAHGHDPATPCGNPGDVYETPFTQSGLVTTSGRIPSSGRLPEPGTLALLGLAMLGLTASRRLGSRR